MDRHLNQAGVLPARSLVIRLESDRTPIEALHQFNDWPDLRCLFSNGPGHPTNRYSFLSADPTDRITLPASQWAAARERIRASLLPPNVADPELPPFQGGWIGWLSYELGTAFDRIARHPVEPHPVPDIALGWYDWVLAWDHAECATWLVSSGRDANGEFDPDRARARADAVLARWRAPAPPPLRPRERSPAPRSDFSAAEYEMAVDRAIEHILDGDIFEVNLAQRFSTTYSGAGTGLFADLAARTGAPMSAYVQHEGVAAISASPERFLRYDPVTRTVETRPIKGTRPRDSDPQRDASNATSLTRSTKDRAENVMIVDLLRNDLSRVCLPGSVSAPAICALESYQTVHHLVSTVVGTLRPDLDVVDLIEATFPGGSITGAPKLRAMEIIASLERVARGVYSGSIAWISLDGAMDSSIAIRTIILDGANATMHAGGAITAESRGADERAETMDKARAMIAAVTDG